jgi:hypothetical protein
METEFAASLEQTVSLALRCCAPEVELTFNRSMIMNESELIDNIIKSKGLVDDEVLRAKHPWVR